MFTKLVTQRTVEQLCRQIRSVLEIRDTALLDEAPPHLRRWARTYSRSLRELEFIYTELQAENRDTRVKSKDVRFIDNHLTALYQGLVIFQQG